MSALVQRGTEALRQGVAPRTSLRAELALCAVFGICGMREYSDEEGDEGEEQRRGYRRWSIEEGFRIRTVVKQKEKGREGKKSSEATNNMFYWTIRHAGV